MLNATINLQMLKAVNRASSTEETRYYLQGVCVEITERRTLHVATNGLILLAANDALGVDSPANTLLGTWIIPASVIKGLKLGKRDTVCAALLTGDGSRNLTIEYNGLKVGFEAIDGTFPDFRRVIPTKIDDDAKPVENAETRYDPRYLVALDAAGADLGIGAPSLTRNGRGPAHVVYGGALFGVIMPMRQGDNRGASRPAWIDRAA